MILVKKYFYRIFINFQNFYKKSYGVIVKLLFWYLLHYDVNSIFRKSRKKTVWILFSGIEKWTFLKMSKSQNIPTNPDCFLHIFSIT